MMAKKIVKTIIHTWPLKKTATNVFQLCEIKNSRHLPSAAGESLLIVPARNGRMKTAFPSILQEKPLKKLIPSITVKLSPVNSYSIKFAENKLAALNNQKILCLLMVQSSIVAFSMITKPKCFFASAADHSRLQPNIPGMRL